MDKNLLGIRIRRNRKKLNLTQAQLGEKICKTGAAIRSYESGISEPPLSVLENLASIFDISLADLLDIDNIYYDNRIFEKYNSLNETSKYMINTLIELEFDKQNPRFNYLDYENFTEEQQEELEEIKKAMIKENEAKNLQSMEKKKIEKNIG